jgi:hypothetical protein
MKFHKILGFFHLIISVISCDSTDKISEENINISILTQLAIASGEKEMSYEASLANWNELKEINGNSYVYQRSFRSWTGYGYDTELWVENGVITKRVYEEYHQEWGPNTPRTILDSYIETGADLGSHLKGDDILTIDDLYKACYSKYLIADTENNTMYFRTENNGMMTICGYVPNNCADDCFIGIRISAFKWIK